MDHKRGPSRMRKMSQSVARWLHARAPGVFENLIATLIVAALGAILILFRGSIFPFIGSQLVSIEKWMLSRLVQPIVWWQAAVGAVLVTGLIGLPILIRSLTRRRPSPLGVISHDSDFTDLVMEARRSLSLKGFSLDQETIQGTDITATENSNSTFRRVVVICEPRRGFVLTHSDLRSLFRLLMRNHIAKAYYVSRSVGPLLDGKNLVKHGACTIERVSYRDFVLEGINFDAYLQWLISEWENSSVAKRYVDMAGRNESGELYRPLDSVLGDLLIRPSGSCVALLGDFGSGKTTFLRYFAAALAKKHLQNPIGSRIPILISLRDYELYGNVEYLVSAELERHGVSAPPDLLGNIKLASKLVFMLDGFDEMSLVADRLSIQRNLQRVQNFACVPDCGFLLSCRTHFFRDSIEEHQLKAFYPIYLEPWSDTELREYLQRTLGSEWKHAFDLIIGTYNLEELAQTPLFLDMTVDSLDSVKGQQIRSAELYTIYTNKWIDAQIYKAVLDRDQKAEFMQELAWKMLTEGRLHVIWSELRDYVQEQFKLSLTEVDRFDNDVRTCSFLRRVDGSYAFIHRSFFEFFAAQHLARDVREDRIDDFCKVEINHEIAGFLAQILDNLIYYERLHLWLETRTEAAYALARRNAANTLRAMSRIPLPPTAANSGSQQIREMADQLLSGADTESRWKAAVSLGWLRSVDGLATLRHVVSQNETDPRILRITALVLGLLGDGGAVPAITQLLQTGNIWLIRQNAAVALGLLGDPAALPSLVDSLQKDESYQVRRSAIWAVETIDPVMARTALTDRALNDDNNEVRQYATLAFGRLGGTSALEVLERAMRDRSPIVRQSALQAIGRIGGAEALSMAQRGLNDPDSNVKDAARYAINTLLIEN